MSQQVKCKEKQKMMKYMSIAKVFLAITPIIGYIYVSLRAMALSISFKELLETMPAVTVVFLIAMINAYVAYLLHLAQLQLKEDHYEFACSNLPLLMLGQFFTGNIVYALMLGWLLHKIMRLYQVQWRDMVHQWKNKKVCIQNGGSVIVSVLAAMCLFIIKQI